MEPRARVDSACVPAPCHSTIGLMACSPKISPLERFCRLAAGCAATHNLIRHTPENCCFPA